MMDAKKLGKQMLDFYRTSFNNSYAAMMMLQEQMERMGNLFLGQMGNLPEDVKKGLAEWNKSYKKSCEDFKKIMDDNFKKLEAFFVEAEKTEAQKSA